MRWTLGATARLRMREGWWRERRLQRRELESGGARRREGGGREEEGEGGWAWYRRSACERQRRENVWGDVRGG
jgi:hypothetical protein